MRRSVFLVWCALALGACTGASGIAPEFRRPSSAGDVSPPTTILGPIDRPRVVLTDEPIAVASTITTFPVPTIPTATVDPPTTTTTTTTTPAAGPAESTTPAEGTVALTFDDGPFEGWTQTILAALDARGVKATFFISTYRLPKVAYLIPVIVAAGHSVQSHGDHHEDLTQKTEEEIRADLATSLDKIVAAGAPRPTCFRPPYGATNELVDRVATELGLTVIGWSLNSLDYSLQDVQGVVDTTLTHVTPGDTILMHDQWAPVWETALPVVIDEIAARGMGFSTICGPSIVAPG